MLYRKKMQKISRGCAQAWSERYLNTVHVCWSERYLNTVHVCQRNYSLFIFFKIIKKCDVETDENAHGFERHGANWWTHLTPKL